MKHQIPLAPAPGATPVPVDHLVVNSPTFCSHSWAELMPRLTPALMMKYAAHTPASHCLMFLRLPTNSLLDSLIPSDLLLNSSPIMKIRFMNSTWLVPLFLSVLALSSFSSVSACASAEWKRRTTQEEIILLLPRKEELYALLFRQSYAERKGDYPKEGRKIQLNIVQKGAARNVCNGALLTLYRGARAASGRDVVSGQRRCPSIQKVVEV